MRDDKVMMLEWAVTGMDCGSCANKVRQAVERVPGTDGVEVALMTERLRLRLDTAVTPPDRVEQVVRGIGFGITPLPTGGAAMHADCAQGHAHGHIHGDTRHEHGPNGAHGAERSETEDRTAGQPNPSPAARRWFRTAKGRYLLATGALLGGAWGAKLFLPDAFADAAFLFACLSGLYPVARRAAALLRAGVPFTIEALMTVAAAGAILIGAAEEAAVVVFLFAVGELLESLAADRARRGIRALSALLPEEALLLHGDHTHSVPAASLQPGQIVRIRPGDRVPCDGRILSGSAGMDEAAITGESLPVARSIGDRVVAGSICTDAAIDVEVTARATENTVARIARMVDEAEATRAPTQRFIESFARVYMPAILVLAVLVAVVPPLVFSGAWGDWAYRALTLLLVGCPCALVISVPAAVASALASGTRAGLLFKGGAALEAAAGVAHVAFDKTGTLTEGAFAVTALSAASGIADDDLLARAAAIEAGSNHPLARAIIAEAKARGLTLPSATDMRGLPGIGAEARIDGRLHRAISLRHAEALGLPSAIVAQASRMEAEGSTLVVVMSGADPIGLIALADRTRPEAATALAALRDLGIQGTILTGDNRHAAGAVAASLAMEVRAELLPEQKMTALRHLSAQGGVMMVGDGVNDAPALKLATIGVAMGRGADVALEAAGAVTLRDDLRSIPAMIDLARRTRAIIYQNVALAIGLKAAFLILSVTGDASLWAAILADTGATVLVTLNALRLQSWRMA